MVVVDDMVYGIGMLYEYVLSFVTIILSCITFICFTILNHITLCFILCGYVILYYIPLYSIIL